MKRKFYVPLVLVVEAEGEREALAGVESLINAICALNPESLLGYSFPDKVEASPASNDWFEHD